MADRINSVLIFLHGLPVKNIFPMIKGMLIISVVLMILIYLVSFSVKTSLSIEELIFLFISVSGLLILSIFQAQKTKSVPQFNVFLNFAIFFIVSKLSFPSFLNDEISINSISKIHDVSFYLLTAAISLTLILRWKALMTHKLFFSGLDLTIIVFMLLTFIVNNILEFDLNYYLSISLLEAFIFYLWYKIVVDLRKKLELKLTMISFVLPISLLITLIFANYI
jgi:hypothetical protein